MDWRAFSREMVRRGWLWEVGPAWLMEPEFGTIGARFVVDPEPANDEAAVEPRLVYHDDLNDESRDALLDALVARCREIDPGFG